MRDAEKEEHERVERELLDLLRDGYGVEPANLDLPPTSKPHCWRGRARRSTAPPPSTRQVPTYGVPDGDAWRLV